MSNQCGDPKCWCAEDRTEENKVALPTTEGMAEKVALPLDPDLLERMDTHLRQAEKAINALKAEHPVIEAEFNGVTIAHRNLRDDLDHAFNRSHPEAMPDPGSFRPDDHRKVGQNR